jgi:hypothetical protein
VINYNEQTRLFELIGRGLKRKIEIYVIGGSAMLYYDSKNATKDIDLVTTSKKDFDELLGFLEGAGFYRKKPFISPKYAGVEVKKPVFLELSGQRIDIFLNEIICFRLSETMKARVKIKHEYGNLIVKIVSPEDIVLLKSATERAGDRQDAKELINRYNINWDAVLEEASYQSGLEGSLFVVYLYYFLYELKTDFKAEIPEEIIRLVRKIGEKKMLEIMANKNKR